MNRPSPSSDKRSCDFAAIAENYRRPGFSAPHTLPAEDRLSPALREMMTLLSRIEAFC